MRMRTNLITMLLSTAWAFCACSDTRPMWSLSGSAVAGLEIERIETHATAGAPSTIGPSCQALMRFQPPTDGVISTQPPEALGSLLLRSEVEQFLCLGSCPAGNGCKLHHMVDSPDPQSARTSCVCDPASPPACRLVVDWVTGQDSRRRIESLVCLRDLTAESCRPVLHHTRSGLFLACEAS